MKRIIKFLIKISGINRSELIAWHDIRNEDMIYELRIKAYDLATMPESKLYRLRLLIEELNFTLKQL